MFKKIVILLLFCIQASVVYAKNTQDFEKLTNDLVKEISKECGEYSNVLTVAKFAHYTLAARKQGEKVSEDFKYKLSDILFEQCSFVRYVGMMNGMKELTPNTEWNEMDGDEKIFKLYDQLEKTLKAHETLINSLAL